MDERIKKRISFALKCKPEEVPEDPIELDKALNERRKKLREAKYDKKHNESIL
jgi:hypothetical protein